MKTHIKIFVKPKINELGKTLRRIFILFGPLIISIGLF
jgi:hypothetical protein